MYRWICWLDDPSCSASRFWLAELLSDKKVAKATHNMIAYKFHDADNGNRLVSDNDDDGEKGSGAKASRRNPRKLR